MLDKKIEENFIMGRVLTNIKNNVRDLDGRRQEESGDVIQTVVMIVIFVVVAVGVGIWIRGLITNQTEKVDEELNNNNSNTGWTPGN